MARSEPGAVRPMPPGCYDGGVRDAGTAIAEARARGGQGPVDSGDEHLMLIAWFFIILAALIAAGFLGVWLKREIMK